MPTQNQGNSSGDSPRDKGGFVSRFLRAITGGRSPESPPGGPRIPLGQSGNKVGPSGGHRGMALGDVGRGREDLSPENQKKWQKLGDNEAGAFVYLGEVLHVHSSNVESAMYDIDSKRMVIAFKSGSLYQYQGVTEDEAIGFANAQSKGSFVWDVLRVRGSRTGSKKSYSKIG